MTAVYSVVYRDACVSRTERSFTVRARVSVNVHTVDTAGDANENAAENAKDDAQYLAVLVESAFDECGATKGAKMASHLDRKVWPYERI